MSAPGSSDPAIAIAHAERRLRLLEMMIRFCMGLGRALQRRSDLNPHLLLTKAVAAVWDAMRLVVALETKTLRRLRILKAGTVKGPGTRPNAAPPPPARAASVNREARETTDTEDDKAFRARLGALEALLDQEALAGGADWTAYEMVQRLCRVMNLDPAWSRCLGDEWIEENLTPRRPIMIPAVPAARPAAAAEASMTFKERLRARVLEAIRAWSHCGEVFTELYGALEKRLHYDEPYMNGAIPMRDAVFKLLAVLDLHPDPNRWGGDGWIYGELPSSGPAPERLAHAHALE